MPKKSKITKEILQDALQTYLNGTAMSTVCSQFHVDKKTIRKAVIASGNKVRTHADVAALKFSTFYAFENNLGEWVKKCSECKEEKPLRRFSKSKDYADGHVNKCYDCRNKIRRPAYKERYDNDEDFRLKCQTNSNRQYHNNVETRSQKHRLMRFGMTFEEYNQRLLNQNFACSACGSNTTGSKGKDWSVDHDHSCCSGKKTCGKCIRGIICHPCNFILGLAKDNPERLRGLAEYLEHYSSRKLLKNHQ